MIQKGLQFGFLFLLLFGSAIAQNKVVVIPLDSSPPVVTQMAFPRISTQCLNGEYVFLEGLGLDVNLGRNSRFFIDDRVPSDPSIRAVLNGPSLPTSASRIVVFVRAIRLPGGVQDILDAEIYAVDGENNPTTSLLNQNNCVSATESTPFSNSGVQDDTLLVTSITGKTWEITSNVTVSEGVITLGPTLFRLTPP